MAAAVLATVPSLDAQTPPPGETGSTAWTQVSVGGSHACGIRTSGRLYCWGDDTAGELGDGPEFVNQATPVQVAGGATDWTSVSAGGGHTCARRRTGRLYCWGWDLYGQLGDAGANANQPVPVEVTASDPTTWVAVSAGRTHTCARKISGRLYCWGSDGIGELGNGAPNTDKPKPVQVAGGFTDWTAVSTGDRFTCARRSSGRLFCWGSDGSGQLGDGIVIADKSAPVQVAGGATDWGVPYAGGAHACSRKVAGWLYCWGDDWNGALGDGQLQLTARTPILVAGVARDWASATAGTGHTCARRTSGRLYCWGSDDHGQVGDGAGHTDRLTPVQVTGATNDWSSVSAGEFETCARKTSGRLYCWGSDSSGQLGNGGANTDQSIPVEVH